MTMTTAALTLRAAGATDPGRQRDVNEDRFHIDRDRGVFMVVDGVGGQAAGGRAADTALEMIRARLTRETGPIADRIREAIAIANNEVHRQASARAEWRGMACVLTVAVVTGQRAVIGHVGDTRLYKLRSGSMQKITRDHSPVGEREDAGEIAELDAMRHPRRHEVYRDVGSEPHEPGDADFVEVHDIPWEPDAALLLCSDGLTDLVPAATIQRHVARHAGDPNAVVRALVREANEAGGKDNITVVYVEGDRFAAAPAPRRRPSRALVHALVWLLVTAAATAAWRAAGYPVPDAVIGALGVSAGNALVVRPGGSINAAIARAAPGAVVLVEPGEYRERLTLTDHVRVVSRVPRGATLRLPGEAAEQDAAVVAVGVTNTELNGFRIVGDAATPLGTAVLTRSASVRLIDLEITGAAVTALDLGSGDEVMLLGSDVRDNPGVGLAVRAQAAPRIAHNTFARNGASEEAAAAMLIEPGARPQFLRNVFHGLDTFAGAALDEAVRSRLIHDNVFPDLRPPSQPPRSSRGRGPAK
jgi:serine/threonine protein phosphatase PrpC